MQRYSWLLAACFVCTLLFSQAGGVRFTPLLPLVSVPETTSRTHLIHQVKATYPEDGRQCLHGDVVSVARNATVRHVSRISGHQLLVYATEKAVRQWMYEPYILNGVPAEFVTRATLHFPLRPVVLPMFEMSVIGYTDSAFCRRGAPGRVGLSDPSTPDKEFPTLPTSWDTC